jgi:glycolate oxidase FAD binding subunit
MTETLTPATAEQVLETVQWAAAEETPLEVTGAGSKRAYGRPSRAAHRLDLKALSGIELYEPMELVMSAKAATPLADIDAALAENRQRLGFEPADLGPLLGAGAGAGTIGGAVICNLSGPGRIKAGAARDHILGFHAVSGRGGEFKSGGRVVKNVTGFDLSKLMAGSFGTLAVMTDVTVKVMPEPEETRTVLVLGAGDAQAVKAMNEALNSAFEISAAAHLPAGVAAVSAVASVAAAGAAVTALRVEGPEPSVVYRAEALKALLEAYGNREELDTAESLAFWRQVRDVGFFVADGPEAGQAQVWRLSVPPAEGAGVAARILDAADGRVFYDWGGGLLWLALAPRPDGGHEAVRGAIGDGGGHATLVRADADVRAAVPVFQPQPAPLARLTARVKEAFDPKGVLNPGRMYEGV